MAEMSQTSGVIARKAALLQRATQRRQAALDPSAAGAAMPGGEAERAIAPGSSPSADGSAAERHEAAIEATSAEAMPKDLPPAARQSPFAALAAQAHGNAARRPAVQTSSSAPGRRGDGDVVEWNDPLRPAGSRYSQAEWEACRRFGANWQGKLAELGEAVLSERRPEAWLFHVAEYHAQQESALIYAPSAYLARARVGAIARDGRIEREVRHEIPPEIEAQLEGGRPSILLAAVDGCLLLNAAALAQSPFRVLAKPFVEITAADGYEAPLGARFPWTAHVIRPDVPLRDDFWDGATCRIHLPAGSETEASDEADRPADPPARGAVQRTRPRG